MEGAASYSDAQLDRIRTIALNEPELVGQLVSRDGRVAGLIVSFALSEPEEPAWAEITAYLRTLLDKARADDPGLSCFLTGNVILNHTFTEAGKDAEDLIPVVFFVILAIATVVLRSLYATLSIAVMIVFIVASTMGTAG
ncbi:MAG: MMPL family transporter [Rhodospirillaceae bacterium]|nr:MMPL family transporter [Rhodospirillaceae bacterium]